MHPTHTPYSAAPPLPAVPGSPATTAEAGEPHCLDLTGAGAGLDPSLDPDLDPYDLGAIAAAKEAGARALWRTWHAGRRPRRVYLVQGPPIECGAEVIAFTDPGHLAPDSRAALANSALLWTKGPARPIRFAAPSDPGTKLDGIDRDRVLAYLAAAPSLLAATTRTEDVVTGTRTAPTGLRTDGAWVWPEATHHYLDNHRLAPDPALLTHIAMAGYTLPTVTVADLHRALAAVQATTSPKAER